MHRLTRAALALFLLPIYAAGLLVWIIWRKSPTGPGPWVLRAIEVGKVPFVAYERWYDRQFPPDPFHR